MHRNFSHGKISNSLVTPTNLDMVYSNFSGRMELVGVNTVAYVKGGGLRGRSPPSPFCINF